MGKGKAISAPSRDRVKQDINFLEYPMWAVSKGLFEKTTLYRLDSKTETYDAYVYKKDDRFMIESITGVPKLFDAVVLMYLLRESQKRGFSTVIDNLTYYQILKACGYGVTKKYYNKLESCLDLWSKTTLRFFGSFYTGPNNRKKMNISPIDSWGSDQIKKRKTIYVRMGAEFVQALKESKYFKYIDFEEYKKFTSPLAARLNELLVKSFLTNKEWKINIYSLATKLTLDLKYPSLMIQKINPALKQVNKNSSKYIYSMSKKNKNNIVVFTRAKREPSLEIPEKLLILIPKKQRPDSKNICLKILKNQGLEALTFYIKNAKARNTKEPLESWGAWIASALKRKEYDNHVKYMADKKAAAAKEAIKATQEAEVRKDEQTQLRKLYEFKLSEIKNMPDDEHEKYLVWLKEKGKKDTDSKKALYLFPFWEDIQKSCLIRPKSGEKTLFDEI